MAVVKISELPAMQTIAGSDILPIVDTSETETKKVTKQMLLTDIDASEVKIGDLSEATQINDADYLIINQSGTNKKISKANARFASGDEISIGTTQPSEEEKLWINPNEVPSGQGSYISNTYGTSQVTGYSQEFINGDVLFSGSNASGSITLNYSANNYKRLKIFFHDANSRYQSQEVYFVNDTDIDLSSFQSTSQNARLMNRVIHINGKNLTTIISGYVLFNSLTRIDDNNLIIIDKIIGYK